MNLQERLMNNQRIPQIVKDTLIDRPNGRKQVDPNQPEHGDDESPVHEITGPVSPQQRMGSMLVLNFIVGATIILALWGLAAAAPLWVNTGDLWFTGIALMIVSIILTYVKFNPTAGAFEQIHTFGTVDGKLRRLRSGRNQIDATQEAIRPEFIVSLQETEVTVKTEVELPEGGVLEGEFMLIYKVSPKRANRNLQINPHELQTMVEARATEATIIGLSSIGDDEEALRSIADTMVVLNRQLRAGVSEMEEELGIDVADFIVRKLRRDKSLTEMRKERREASLLGSAVEELRTKGVSADRAAEIAATITTGSKWTHTVTEEMKSGEATEHKTNAISVDANLVEVARHLGPGFARILGNMAENPATAAAAAAIIANIRGGGGGQQRQQGQGNQNRRGGGGGNRGQGGGNQQRPQGGNPGGQNQGGNPTP